jgi:hypothetical protein
MQESGRSKAVKPLGCKAYGSIPHLPGSRLGPGDHHCELGQARIATEKTRDKHDFVIVQEKLDGSCCAVAKLNGQIIPLTRAGYHVKDSQYCSHYLFGQYVYLKENVFQKLLNEGERIVGEWLYQAHGTVYNMPHEPFVVFDIFRDNKRVNFDEFSERTYGKFQRPKVLYAGHACSIEYIMNTVFGVHINGFHGAVDGPEGAIWRVERKGEVDFLVKYVRHDKIDGKYLPENNNGKILLNTFQQWQF